MLKLPFFVGIRLTAQFPDMSYTAALFDSLLRASAAEGSIGGGSISGGYRAGSPSGGTFLTAQQHYSSLPHGGSGAPLSFGASLAAAQASAAATHAAGLAGEIDMVHSAHAAAEARLPGELDECYAVIRFQRTQASQLRTRLAAVEEHNQQVRSS